MTQPVPAFNFQVEFDGNVVAFSEVTGLNAEVGIIEYRVGNDAEAVTRKIPGLRKFTNVTLKRGVVLDDNGLFEWFAKSAAGSAERRSVRISLLNEERDPVVTWKLVNALPVKYSGPTFDAAANRVAIEELHLTHEGLQVSQP